MPEYEFTFVVDVIDEQQEAALMDDLDAFIGGHGRLVLVTVAAEGPNALAAAQQAVSQMRHLGVHARRLYDDLVTRGQIAERAGVTRQAVGLWARGERHVASTFPDPFYLNAGGQWRWADVNAWLRENGYEADDIEYPTADECALINVLLSTRTTRVGLIWTEDGVRTQLASATATTHSPASPTKKVDWTKARRTDFALGA